MEKIDPNQNKDMLGVVRKSVWKVPFRLTDIPFFDTSFLCDPNEISNLTGYESDTEPWDAPMRRRKNVSSEIRSQIGYGYDRRRSSNIEVFISADDDMLVNEPFSRDPTIPMRKFAPRNYEYSPIHRAKSPKSPASPVSNAAYSRYTPPPVCHSPTPYSKPSVSNIRNQFNDGTDPVMVYKKRSAPRPPSDDFYPMEPARRNSKKRQAPQPQPRVSSPKPGWSKEVNPIKELEAIAKRNGNGNNVGPLSSIVARLMNSFIDRMVMRMTIPHSTFKEC